MNPTKKKERRKKKKTYLIPLLSSSAQEIDLTWLVDRQVVVYFYLFIFLSRSWTAAAAAVIERFIHPVELLLYDCTSRSRRRSLSRSR